MIYLLRHGTLEGDMAGKYLGQMDIHLDTNGRKQAENWATYFSEQHLIFDSILSSDLIRCKATANIIASSFLQTSKVTLMPELREINMGEWDGIAHQQIKNDYPDAWGSHGTDPAFRPPGGESFASLQERTFPVIENIINENSRANTLIVTHAGVIRCVICRLLDIPLSRLFGIELNYAGLCAINCRRKPASIAYINRIISSR